MGKGKAKNPFFRKESKAKQDEKAKTDRIMKKYKEGKITDLKMQHMGYFRNGNLEIKVTQNPWNIEIILNTPDGKMSAAQYMQTYCRNEELTRYILFRFCIK